MTVFEKIVFYYGIENQKRKAIEELSELIRAISRDDNRSNVIEEIADVMIMLEQLKIIYAVVEDDVWKTMEEKLSRTIDRMYNDQMHKEIQKIGREKQ